MAASPKTTSRRTPKPTHRRAGHESRRGLPEHGTGKTWHYEFVSDGKRYRGSTGFAVKEKKKAKAKKEEIKVQVREGHSLEMVWEQHRRRLAAGKAIAFSQEALWDAFSKNVVAGKARVLVGPEPKLPPPLFTRQTAP